MEWTCSQICTIHFVFQLFHSRSNCEDQLYEFAFLITAFKIVLFECACTQYLGVIIIPNVAEFSVGLCQNPITVEFIFTMSQLTSSNRLQYLVSVSDTDYPRLMQVYYITCALQPDWFNLPRTPCLQSEPELLNEIESSDNVHKKFQDPIKHEICEQSEIPSPVYIHWMKATREHGGSSDNYPEFPIS